MLTAVVVDDELAGRIAITRHVANHPEINLVGQAASAATAIALITRRQPDVVLLDVEMPGGDGFSILPGLPRPPRIVFVSAYARYAIRAFEVEAVDFLVEPVEPARFARTVRRLKRLMADHPAPQAAPVAAPATIAIPVRRGKRFVVISDILAVIAKGDDSRLHLAEHSNLEAKWPIGAFAKELPLPPFQRVGRSLILNMNRIDKIETISRDESRVTLQGNRCAIMLGRHSAVNLRDLRVSPEHAIFMGDILVQAAALVDGVTVLREQSIPEQFTYCHVELASHELLLAEGVPAESFVDNVDRMHFHNWDARTAPEEAIVELPIRGPSPPAKCWHAFGSGPCCAAPRKPATRQCRGVNRRDNDPPGRLCAWLSRSCKSPPITVKQATRADCKAHWPAQTQARAAQNDEVDATISARRVIMVILRRSVMLSLSGPFCETERDSMPFGLRLCPNLPRFMRRSSLGHHRCLDRMPQSRAEPGRLSRNDLCRRCQQGGKRGKAAHLMVWRAGQSFRALTVSVAPYHPHAIGRGGECIPGIG